MSVDAVSCDVFDNSGFYTEKSVSCISDSSDNSFWFYFVAKEEAITITVNSNAGLNPIKSTTLTLLESSNKCSGSFRVIGCDSRENSISTITINSLIPNNEYYILVDGIGSSEGSFQLCLNSYSINDVIIRGKVSTKIKTFKYLKSMLISLKADDGKIVSSVNVDESGLFEFKRLPYQNNYFITIEALNTPAEFKDEFLLSGEIYSERTDWNETEQPKLFYSNPNNKLYLIQASLDGTYKFEFLYPDINKTLGIKEVKDSNMPFPK